MAERIQAINQNMANQVNWGVAEVGNVQGE